MRTPMRLGIAMSASLMTACVLAISASSALAVNQLTASGGNVTGALRDDLTTPPTNGGYGADLLLNNTQSIIRLTANSAGVNQSPRYDGFLGLKLHQNPTAANCSMATGRVLFADFQNSTLTSTGGASPTYAGTVNNAGTATPWPVTINSAMCGAPNVPDQVTVTGVALYFPTLGTTVTGTITGKYEQPGTNCSAGGVRLDTTQSGLTISGSTAIPGIDNGAGGNAYLCFVSANNYVYPTTPQGLGALTGSIANN